MDQAPGPAIGNRVNFYRRLNKMSAEALAASAGGGITRGVIANIESGKKKDLYVSELIALSHALGVPPAALVYDLHRPAATRPDGWPDPTSLVSEINWFAGKQDYSWMRSDAGAVAFQILDLLEGHRQTTALLAETLEQIKQAHDSDAPAPVVDGLKRDATALQSKLSVTAQRLESLGVDLYADPGDFYG